MLINYTKKDLHTLIKEYMGLSPTDNIPPIILNQITRYIINEQMSYKEIGRCICYYVEKEHKEINPLYGIAFVLNIRDAANKYFIQLENNKKQKEEEAKKFIIKDDVVIYNIKEIVKKKTPPKLQELSFDDVNLKEEEDGK